MLVLRDEIFKNNSSSYRECMEGLCWAHLVPLPPRHIKNQISRELPRYMYSMQMDASLVECLHVYHQAW